MSIRTKLIFFISLLVIVISTLSSLVFFINQKKVYEEALKKLGSSLVMPLARDKEIRFALGQGQDEFAKAPIKRMREFDRENEIGYWRLSKEQEVVKEEKVSWVDMDMKEIPIYSDSKTPNLPLINRQETASGEILYDFSAPVFEADIFSEEDFAAQFFGEKNEPRILGFIQIGLSTRKLNEKINKTILYSIIPTGAGIIIGGVFFAIFLTKYMIFPLQRLTSITQDISKGDFTRTIDIRSHDEVGQLSAHFNEMTNALKGSFNDLNREIEQHKQTSKELRDSEMRLQSILDNATAVVYMKNVSGDYLFVNREFEKLFHISRRDAQGKTDYALFSKEMAAAFRANDLSVIKTGTPLQFDEEVPQDDGLHTFISVKFPLYDSTGKIYAVCGISTDITERKKAEVALRMSEGKYRMLLENLPQRIFYKDKDLVYVSCNENYASDLKIGANEIEGKTDYAFYPKDLAEKYRADDKHVLDTGQVEEIEDQYVKEGKEFIINMVKTPIRDEEGNIIGILGVFWDITEKVMYQREALRMRQLASIGELAAGVAHEVNNPINSIINCAQLMFDESKTGSDEEDFSNRILKEGKRIANIVGSLLSFARRGDKEDGKCSSRIIDMISGTFILLESQMKGEGIKIKKDIPESLPEVIVNPQHIQQVFFNIISNARYALNQRYSKAHDNKILDIVGEEIVIDNCPYVKVLFYDRGTGIPDEVQDKILDPFFTIKPRGKGTGLGLSISHGIVSKHGGRLVVDSIDGEYTKVSVILPMREIA